MVAPGIKTVIIDIVGIAVMQHPSAVLAAGVAAVIAAPAQGCVGISGVIVRPDPFSAVLTDDGFGSQAAGTILDAMDELIGSVE